MEAEKRRSGIGGGTPAKKAMENSKGRDVIIVLDGEDSKTTTPQNGNSY